jgi:Lrp/AsnC family transcriptional regulator, leucine-responsive regulatory protein
MLGVVESIDRQILALLSRDGRMSYTDIGRETGLSTSAAQQRVRRLEKRGTITAYRAVVNPAALGYMLTAIISLEATDPSQEDEIATRIEHLPEIVSCYSVAGGASHLLKAHVAGPGELELLLSKIRNAAGVATRTQLVLSAPFEDRPLV